LSSHISLTEILEILNKICGSHYISVGLHRYMCHLHGVGRKIQLCRGKGRWFFWAKIMALNAGLLEISLEEI
jgi:hypothetical protein